MVVMLPQNIFAKIVFKIAPDGVDMVRVVLRVIVFHQKRGPLDAIIMRLAAFLAAAAQARAYGCRASRPAMPVRLAD